MGRVRTAEQSRLAAQRYRAKPKGRDAKRRCDSVERERRKRLGLCRQCGGPVGESTSTIRCQGCSNMRSISGVEKTIERARCKLREMGVDVAED